MKKINFYTEKPLQFVLAQKKLIRKWLMQVAKKEGYSIENLNYIFCTDAYLYEINMTYLKHDTYTDVITFDQSEAEKIIEGDVFISKERVKENAKLNLVAMPLEMRRIMVHGLLHLCGYTDKSKSDKRKMTELEDKYLSWFSKICNL